jgi:hypothetical protein
MPDNKQYTVAEVARMLQELDLFDCRYAEAEAVLGIRKGLKYMTQDELNRMAAHCIAQGYMSWEMKNLEADKMRKKIISLLRSIGFEKDRRADMPRILEYVQKVGYGHKPLNDYKHNELPKLVTQMEQIVNKEIKNFRKQ